MWTNAQDQALQERARAVIPNGMWGHQSIALMPESAPQFFTRAEGTRLWDADGNEYLDFMCAYGPNLLGYGQKDVQAAVLRQMELGDTMTGPGAVAVELAEALTGMITHADWAIFCKSGAEATSMALVTARAHRGRRKILLAKGAYHGAHPWNTPRPAGTVAEDRAHLIYFDYNDLDSFEAAVKQAGDDFAGVFASPFRHDTFTDQTLPDAEYAAGVRRVCDERDALLIVDEVRAGFRLSRDLSWSEIGVEPDISCWGKVLGNGQPISCMLGNDKARKAAGSIFVTGSFWFSAVPMAAALETLRLIRETDYLERIREIGTMFRQRLVQQAAEYGFGLRHTGPVTMPMVLFEDDPDYRLGYRFSDTAMRNGAWLSPYHNMFINAAMTPQDIERALEITGIAFDDLRRNRASVQPSAKLAALLPR